MPLLQFWNSSPEAVADLSIEQVVANAGDGVLRDGSECSSELRQYLAEITSEKLGEYIDHCQSQTFKNNGFVLQDLVNELGNRLGYSVTHGRYQGTTKAVGYDGAWRAPEGHVLVVEVKTTDVYRITLDTLAKYRDKVQAEAGSPRTASILIVVARVDTGELEAQIRGSRHAWDVRLVSADSLLKLVRIREQTDDPATGSKIRRILQPFEYTRLDEIVDVLFTTTQDVDAGAALESSEPQDEGDVGTKDKGTRLFTDSQTLQSKRESIVATIGRREGIKLVKNTRATYWDSDRQRRLACTISKRYKDGGYWYAYHPNWDDFLSEGKQGWFVLGGVDLDIAFALPRDVIRAQLDYLHTTTTKKDPPVTYWHVIIREVSPEQFEMNLPKGEGNLPLDDFIVALKE
jgi:hypothetical protein